MFEQVATLDQLRANTGHVVWVNGKPVALFLHGGQVYAMDDVCPHMGASLGSGAVVDGVVCCPWHGWRFRVTDGAWVSVPKNRNRTFAVKIEGNEVLLEMDS